MGWPRRRISSVLGGIGRVRKLEFGGRRPYCFQSERQSASGRWEIWMDADQARAVRAASRATRRRRAARTRCPGGRRGRSPS